MKFGSDQPDIYCMFFVVIWYLDKEKTYQSLVLNVDFFLIFEKKNRIFMITSSENVYHNLSKWFFGINIMPMVFWSQSRWQIIEINKTID